jgi:hypothetical protein
VHTADWVWPWRAARGKPALCPWCPQGPRMHLGCSRYMRRNRTRPTALIPACQVVARRLRQLLSWQCGALVRAAMGARVAPVPRTPPGRCMYAALSLTLSPHRGWVGGTTCLNGAVVGEASHTGWPRSPRRRGWSRCVRVRVRVLGLQQQRRWRAEERRYPTGRERMGSPTLQTLQKPILLPPCSGFEVAAFQTF